MTRGHITHPVWTWYCDRCGATSSDLAWTQKALPSPSQMRKRGWYIADLWGDLCSRCVQNPPIEWSES